jgi:transposase-like protein
MADAERSPCPRCNSDKTEQMKSRNKLGLTMHECKACGAQFTVQTTSTRDSHLG